jgi:hypothetical protein
MRTYVLIWAAVASTSLVAQEPTRISAPANSCVSLRDLRLPDVRFTDIVDVLDDGDNGDNVRAPHCRVTGVISKEILFVAMLPNSWNQRLLMGGNGGFAGSINQGIERQATNGYLTVSTNTGHDEKQASGASWALNQPERQINYAFLAVHRTVEVAKVLAKAFYGSEPRFSYFSGCSNGGRQALMEVQRYPEDFDGVIAGAPAIPFSSIFASFDKNMRAAYPSPAYYTRPVVTQANLDLLASRVLAACDALDGVSDGVLGDPRDCRFKLASLPACPGERAAKSCVTTAQRNAIARIYAPLRDARGRTVYPGQPFGGENLEGAWGAWIVGADTGQYPSAQPFFAIEGAKYMVFNNPKWDYTTYRGDLIADATRIAPLYDADDPKISHFGKKGKLILWHGWADPALNPLETIDYYQRVLASDANAREYVRLFMLPGVLHCAGGNGPSDVSWLRAITEWVEKGVAPEQLNAVKRDSTARIIGSRPVCSYPRRAVYKGSGNTEDAANFSCAER